ncbi:MAG: hypothetical protein ACTH0V_05195 [Microbacteriaceae bacterium]
MSLSAAPAPDFGLFFSIGWPVFAAIGLLVLVFGGLAVAVWRNNPGSAPRGRGGWPGHIVSARVTREGSMGSLIGRDRRRATVQIRYQPDSRAALIEDTGLMPGYVPSRLSRAIFRGDPKDHGHVTEHGGGAFTVTFDPPLPVTVLDPGGSGRRPRWRMRRERR